MRRADDAVPELLQIYDDVVALDERPEGFRYRARIRGGAAVVVTAIAPELTERLIQPAAFVARFLETADRGLSGFPRRVNAGRSGAGLLHVACEDVGAVRFPAGTMRVAEIASAGAAVARSLHAAHAAGVLHGAIATERLARAGDSAILEGLGIVDALAAAGMGPADASMAVTDIAYVAPEVQEGRPADARSDIYGLGAALYEILTGKPPFGGRTTSYVMATVLSDEEAAASEERASGPVIEAILRAIEANPADRWPDAESFANALSVGSLASRESGGDRVSGCLPRALAFGVVVAVTAAALYH